MLDSLGIFCYTVKDMKIVSIGAFMKKENRKLAKTLVLITQLGLNVLVTIFLCVWFGDFLDKRFGTGFWMIVFLLLGVLAAYRNAYMMTKSFYAKDKEREDKEAEYWEDFKREREKNEREEKHGKR